MATARRAVTSKEPGCGSSHRSHARSPDRWLLSRSEDEETTVVGIAHIGAVRVVVGVDTQKDEHVAVAIDRSGAHRGECRCQPLLQATRVGSGRTDRRAVITGRSLTEVAEFQ